jgi:RNA polymerase sigma factor (TIGR02999 family)
MPDVTQILSRIDAGDPVAAEQLLPLVYEELKKLAAAKLAHEKPGQTLQATALVHEAYLRLVGSSGDGQQWNSSGHFFGAAAEAMRRILVDSARRKASSKYGGQRVRVSLDGVDFGVSDMPDDLLLLDESLLRLADHDPTAAKLVELRYFAGMTIPQAAEALGISLRTAERNWTYARTWLHRDMS